MNAFTDILLRWYGENKRQLPWRDITNPYYIWISEIILQQTRIEQGRDYYLRFISRFPDVSSLASADEDEVLLYWQGLGYYSRARNLHAAARSMKDGLFPTTYEGVRALKGVGDYTAAAICSFAYGMPVAVVDGNVYRVLSRYFGIDEPIDTVSGKKLFTAMAQEMLDPAHPADYNQALVDFGAMQCTPSSPLCQSCPLMEGCSAFREHRVGDLPVKSHHVQVVNRYFNYLFIYTPSTALIRKRSGSDIWRGLYEVPLIETAEAMDADAFLKSEPLVRYLGDIHPDRLQLLRRDVKHVLTHRIIWASFYSLFLDTIPASLKNGYQEVPLLSLSGYAFPRLLQEQVEKMAGCK